jgi:hypothetical protein
VKIAAITKQLLSKINLKMTGKENKNLQMPVNPNLIINAKEQ